MEISAVFAILSFIGLAGYLMQIKAVRSYIGAHPQGGKEDGKTSPETSFPPVSILKPLKGLDDNLYDNLESFCRLDYPAYEIIFALQSWNDPACKVARKIKDKHPDIDISLQIEDMEAGLNPKVNNLMPAYRISKYPLVLISDSNVMVGRDYLKETVREMADPSVGLVCNLIRGMGGRSMGALFENLHMNSFVMGSVCFLDKYLGMPCVIGKSMLMRKSDMERIGGLRGVCNVLAEDYLLGKRMAENGMKVVVSSYLIDNVNNYWGMRKFLNRHTRWAKLRWHISGLKYISELICNPVLMASLPVFLLGPSVQTLTPAGIVSCVKILGDYAIGRRIGCDLRKSAYLFTPFKDLLIGALWIVPFISSTVVWRGNTYVIGKDSRLSPYPGSGVWALKYRLMNAIASRLA
jgi:ceramide glucosyltransferase